MTGGHTLISRRLSRRRRYAARGQALIMAVLIMFLLAGLGGLFVATLNQALIQTARNEERVKLEEIVNAGLEHATNHLLYSQEGADWRPDAGPDPNNPGWHDFGGGFYNITLTYGPTARADISAANPMGANPLQRYLKVDVEARFALDNMPDPRIKEPYDAADPVNKQFQKNDPATFQLYSKGFLDPRRFLTRRRTAFVPIGLTDYLVWITNQDGRPDPAVLAPDVDLGNLRTVNQPPDSLTDAQLNDPANGATISCAYRELYSGPIHCDGNLSIGGNARIDLTSSPVYTTNFAVTRQDDVEVVGQASPYNADATTDNTRIVQDSPNAAMGAVPAVQVADPLVDSANAAKLRIIQTRLNNPLIRPMKAPVLDQRDPTTNMQRYRALTEESALWEYNADPQNAGSSAYTSQMLGWGNGLYLDDKYTSVQHDGDLQALQNEWLNPKDPGSQGLTWVNGVYHPENAGAVEITLHDWEFDDKGNATRLPYLELHRYDGGQFYNKANQPVGERTTLPYPRNGVIFAEGNVIVKGNLPASLDFNDTNLDGVFEPEVDAGGVQHPGGWDPSGSGIHYYITPANRRYDLTVVSNGTVYIEGNLLGPATRNATFQNGAGTSPITLGSVYDSKLGLLARDNVCLNPTKIVSSASRDTETVGDEQLWRIRANDPLDFTFSTSGDWSPRTRLLLRHGGAAVVGQPDYGVMRMAVNNQPFVFDTTAKYASGDPLAERLCFGDPPTIDLRCPWWDNALLANGKPVQWGGGLYANDPLEQQTWDINSNARYTSGASPLLGHGALNTVRFEWQEGCDYLLAASKTMSTLLVTGMDVQVDALVYAQRGSWFIIPGVFYNDPADPNTDLEWPFPKPGEPLDVRLIFHGAIVENRPASPEAQEAWITHWRGSNLAYYATDNTTPNQLDPGADPTSWNPATWRWTNRRMGIEYYYDATLMRPVCFQDDGASRYFSPRLPKLPVCPSVFSIGVMQNT